MTHSPGDPQAADALREFHAQLSEDELTAADLALDDTTAGIVDPTIMEAVRWVGMETMSPEARDLLVRLTDFSENLEPAARQLLVSAADRALQWRRHNSGSLPVLLFARRGAQKLSAEDMSVRLEVPEKTLSEIEAGASPLYVLAPVNVAKWIDFLGVEFDTAEAALLRGLERRHPTARVAGALVGPLDSDDHEEFVNQVLAQLRGLRGRSSIE